ncbi:MAG: rhomboid family intramembrane serine protease [Proteobacteria bacterium]|nr:rhomboid family intramembrane serine protease [Pseudomonadota bacterium]
MFKKNKKKPTSAGTKRFFPEIWAYILMILLCNVHIITGNLPNELVFYPNLNNSKAFMSIFTHPFVHVSWYHLLLDGAGFFVVYSGIQQTKMTTRLAYVAFCCTGSILLPLLFSSFKLAYGLCGLSGIAHGLMAISALEMANGKTFKIGIICFAIVFTKSIIEAVSGNVLFSFLHFGLMGLPVASTHLGGVLGGCFAYFMFNGTNRLYDFFKLKQKA